jgi:hypothetical protein
MGQAVLLAGRGEDAVLRFRNRSIVADVPLCLMRW